MSNRYVKKSERNHSRTSQYRAHHQVPVPDSNGNLIAREGIDRCWCGCKYWEHDRCIDCSTHINDVEREL